MASTRRLPKPFKYRGRWRAQVTLRNGTRPHCDFDEHQAAVAWIVDQLANANAEHAPELGGPTRATLAQALKHYAELYTIGKASIDSELTRINHYLVGDAMAPLRKARDDAGKLVLQPFKPRRQPKGWQEHNDQRREQRAQTYAQVRALARKTCSAINPADIRRLMATMSSEGLSDSTIQKEIALLRHMFNVAGSEWSWLGFKNPTAGIKLGKSQARFVFITQAQQDALWQAISECDNPYFWPLVVCALETTLRRSSLLALRWDQTDLDGRIAQVTTKTGVVAIPLSQRVVAVLRGMVRHGSGLVFPMSGNAVEMAWDGVRRKAALPTLQFKDIRHLGATEYARRGLNAHQLRAILGHKTLHMAQVYVNLVHQDVLNAMDSTAPAVPVVQVPPAATGTAEAMLNEKRSMRLAKAAKAAFAQSVQPSDGGPSSIAQDPHAAPAPAPAPPDAHRSAAVVVSLATRRRIA